MKIGKKKKKVRNTKRILTPEETPERFVTPKKIPVKLPVPAKVPLPVPKEVNTTGG
jgi:hypothetical protein